RRASSRRGGRAAASARRAWRRAASRRGSRAARPSGRPAARARSPGPCGALALAARERRRLAIEQLVEAERLGHLLHPPLAIGLRELAQLEPVLEIVPDVH